MKLYKYMALPHAAALVQRGEIRIGTVVYYQKGERLRPGIRDAREGRRVIAEVQEGRPTFHELSPFAKEITRKVFLGGRPDSAIGPDVLVHHNTFVRKTVAPNCWIYCASREYSVKTWVAMGSQSAVVEIVDAGEFFNVLTRVMAEYLRRDFQWLFGPVQYEPEVPDARTALEIDPPFNKGDDLIDQQEYRSAWIPLKPGTEEPEPVPLDKEYEDLIIPGLCRFVRGVKLPGAPVQEPAPRQS